MRFRLILLVWRHQKDLVHFRERLRRCISSLFVAGFEKNSMPWAELIRCFWSDRFLMNFYLRNSKFLVVQRGNHSHSLSHLNLYLVHCFHSVLSSSCPCQLAPGVCPLAAASSSAHWLARYGHNCSMASVHQPFKHRWWSHFSDLHSSAAPSWAYQAWSILYWLPPLDYLSCASSIGR